MGQRSEDRHGTGLKKVLQSFGVDVLDVPYVTEIDWLDGTFHTHYQVEVGSGKTYGVDSESLETGDQILVDESAVNHRDDLQHLGAGDPAAIDHLGLDTKLGCDLSGDLAAAVHENLFAFKA